MKDLQTEGLLQAGSGRPPSIKLTSDPSDSYTLPTWAYLDPEIYEREKREIFYREWQYAGWAGDVAEPGQYITAKIMDQGIIIIRDQAGELRGFHNVCQHRGHELLQGCGKVSAIICPYHAWAYKTDGSLRTARGARLTPGFDPSIFNLKPISVEVVADKLLFASLDPNATPLAEKISDLIADIRTEVPQFDALKRVDIETYPGSRLFPVEANWKIVIDNFLECYHCRNAHPGLSSDIDMATYKTTDHGLWSKQKGKTRADDGAEVTFWTLFPNVVLINRSGGLPRLSVMNFAVPDGLTRTNAGLFDRYRLPGDENGPEVNHWGDVGREDRELCESVQRGLGSLGYDQGRFMYDPENGETTEVAVHGFHREISRALGL